MLQSLTFKALPFLPRSLLATILISLFGLGMLLICDATGEGIDPLTGVRVSCRVSGTCFNSLGFLAVCCPKRTVNCQRRKMKVREKLKLNADIRRQSKMLEEITVVSIWFQILALQSLFHVILLQHEAKNK